MREASVICTNAELYNREEKQNLKWPTVEKKNTKKLTEAHKHEFFFQMFYGPSILNHNSKTILYKNSVKQITFILFLELCRQLLKLLNYFIFKKDFIYTMFYKILRVF